LLGVFGRANPLTGTAYIAAVDFANSFFALGRNDDFAGFISILALDLSVAIDANETYEIQLFLLGSNVVGRLIDASSGQILSTITAIDALYGSGVGGVLVETEYIGDIPVGPVIGTFDNVRAVPEPSAVPLIGVGTLGVVCLATSRRRGRASPATS
jgi:hypothetical protein